MYLLKPVYNLSSRGYGLQEPIRETYMSTLTHMHFPVPTVLVCVLTLGPSDSVTIKVRNVSKGLHVWKTSRPPIIKLLIGSTCTWITLCFGYICLILCKFDVAVWSRPLCANIVLQLKAIIFNLWVNRSTRGRTSLWYLLSSSCSYSPPLLSFPSSSIQSSSSSPSLLLSFSSSCHAFSTVCSTH